MNDDEFLKKLEEGNDLSDEDLKLVEKFDGPAPKTNLGGVNTCPICDACIAQDWMTTCPQCGNGLSAEED